MKVRIKNSTNFLVLVERLADEGLKMSEIATTLHLSLRELLEAIAWAIADNMAQE